MILEPIIICCAIMMLLYKIFTYKEPRAQDKSQAPSS